MTPLYVAPDQLNEAWPFVVRWIAAALDRSGNLYSPDDIKAECQRNAMQLWVVENEGAVVAVIVTTILEYPQKKVCQILICTGEGREGWQEMVGLLEDWARSQGCDLMRPVARGGWARILKPLGYKQTHVVLEKEL